GLSAGEPLVELLQADDPASPIARFVAKRGPGIHHICFSVDDLDATLDRCRKAGVQLLDEKPRIGAEGKRIAFLHPKSTGGVLVRSIVSRAGPFCVPHTVDIACRSFALTALRNCSAASLGADAPVSCPLFPALVALEHAITNNRTATFLNDTIEFSTG